MSDERGQILYRGGLSFKATYEDYAMEPIVLVKCPVHGGGVVRAVDVHIDCCDEMTIEQRGYGKKR